MQLISNLVHCFTFFVDSRLILVSCVFIMPHICSAKLLFLQTAVHVIFCYRSSSLSSVIWQLMHVISVSVLRTLLLLLLKDVCIMMMMMMMRGTAADRPTLEVFIY